jgi:peptidoglycan hydrolase-like protein with peptidoglycan-binding domain
MLLSVGVVIGSGATAYLAGRIAGPPNPTAAPATYTVSQGSLGRDLTLPASASWPVEGVVRAPAAGLVTEVRSQSGYLSSGSILMRVEERAVVLIPGEIPAFRTLTVGVRGRDVRALQEFLKGAGYRTDSDLSAYTSVTADAVRRWHRDLGLGNSPTVSLGDIVIVPSEWIARPMRWEPGVVAGQRLAAGDPILDVLGETPQVIVDFAGSMPAQLASGDRLVATFSSGQTRPMTLTDPVSQEGRTYSILRTAGPLCASQDCLALVPLAGDASVQAKFTLVPDTSGPLVPVAALRSDSAGKAFVVLEDGTRRGVEIVVVDGGMAVVSGVEAGDVLLLP